MIVHVICCNSSVEYAVLNDEKRAREKLLELKEACVEKNTWLFRDRKDYEMWCYWHIHTVFGE